LYLNVIPFEDVNAYYDFVPGVSDDLWELSNWSFGDGLEYLVNQLDLRWWPERPPLKNVAALINIQDPIGIRKPTCDGVEASGACWYYGAAGESCEQVCTGHGDVDADATIKIAGSGGSWAACNNIFNALGAPAVIFGDSPMCLVAAGCVYDTSGAGRGRCITPPTTTTASHPVARRVCACQQ
jgi:hypothetical protein